MTHHNDRRTTRMISLMQTFLDDDQLRSYKESIARETSFMRSWKKAGHTQEEFTTVMNLLRGDVQAKKGAKEALGITESPASSTPELGLNTLHCAP